MSDTIVVQDTVIEPSSDKPLHQQRVEEFMRRAGQPTTDKPTIPDIKTIMLRAALLYEEYAELLEAMGIIGEVLPTVDEAGDQYPPFIEKDCVEFFELPDGAPDLVKITDAICDLSVVLYGTASAFGLALTPLLELVDKNNSLKFAEGHSISPSGKLIKPPNHQPPDFKKALIEQGWCPPDDQGMP